MGRELRIKNTTNTLVKNATPPAEKIKGMLDLVITARE